MERINNLEMGYPTRKLPSCLDVPSNLQEVLDSFSDLHMPDPMPLLVTLGAVAGSRFKGFPVHLFLIGPPSCGKNDVLEALFDLPRTHHISTFTEASMLSGTSRKDRSHDASGGLLEEIKKSGNEGIFILTEFNSILSLSPDKRLAALGTLQNVCSGILDRKSGSDGGVSLHFKGKVQVICGCTENIEGSRDLLGRIGERFIYCRFPPIDREAQARAALRNARNGEYEDAVQRRVQAVTSLMAGLQLPTSPGSLLDQDDDEVLIAIAVFMTLARSPVPRDDRSREVVNIYEAEGPARALLELQRLLCGLRVIGIPKKESLDYVSRVALGSIPNLRRAIIQTVGRNEGQYITTAQIRAELADWGGTTIDRALQDLVIHGILEKYQGSENYWTFSEDSSDNWFIGFGALNYDFS